MTVGSYLDFTLDKSHTLSFYLINQTFAMMAIGVNNLRIYIFNNLIMDASRFANAWIASWNSHDIADILSHYSEDIEIQTPMIKIAFGDIGGSLIGKELVAAYWRRALEKFSDLHFELYEVTEGVNSVAIYYQSILDKKAIEVMFFNDEGKVNKMIAHYV